LVDLNDFKNISQGLIDTYRNVLGSDLLVNCHWIRLRQLPTGPGRERRQVYKNKNILD